MKRRVNGFDMDPSLSPVYVDYGMLLRKGACQGAKDEFYSLFGDAKVPVTRRNLRLVVEDSDALSISWLAEKFLGNSAASRAMDRCEILSGRGSNCTCDKEQAKAIMAELRRQYPEWYAAREAAA